MMRDNHEPTKERILTETLELLDREGADGVTIRRVAEAADVSVSVVHHHFRSKQGLLDACKTNIYDKLRALVASVLVEAQDRTTEETVDLVVRDAFSFARVNIGVVRMIGRDVFGTGERMEAIREYDRRPLAAIADKMLAPALGLSPELTRVRLQAITVLLVRFAVSSEQDLAELLGYAGESAAAAAEDHVADMARLLLFGGSPG